MIVFSCNKSLYNSLERNIGLTICPEVSVHEELVSGRLVKLAWEEPDMETGVIMIWHAERWRSPLLKRFMELSKEVIS